MRRVTLQDVAADAGVSRAAASMVVRGTGRLSDQTRERVRRSMEKLGYIYNRNAASLRSNRSWTLGFIVTDFSNPYFSAIALAFEKAASAAGYMTLISNTFDDPGHQDGLVTTMLESPVAGLAYVPALGAAPVHLPIPTLALTRPAADGGPALSSDAYVAGEMAAAHLAGEHGFRRIAYLGGAAAAVPTQERIAGVRAAMGRYPDAELAAVVHGQTSIDGGARLAEELLRSGAAFDAVICHSDVIAYGVLRALHDAGLGLGRIGVIGFDSLAASEVFIPSITSVSVGTADLGRLAAEWLIRAVDDDAIEAPLPLSPHLDVRESCGCATSQERFTPITA
ncbi:MAG: LacI family transcriptional regulator [Microbacterium sp.]|nr:LacI family transcriptional regulator [Microbacterium sp.]